MIGPNRAAATLLGTAVVAVLLWVAAQFDMHSTGGYWAALGVVAAAGLALGLLAMRGRTGHPPTMLLAFVPAFIVGAWVLLAMQPHNEWGRHLIRSWSGDIHLRGLVDDVGMWVGVIAFAIGYVFGTVLEPAPARREAAVLPRETRTGTAPTTRPAAVTHDRMAADEPTTAERREIAAERDGASPARATTGDDRTIVR